MTHYLGFGFLLLLLLTIMVIGRPFLRGLPLEPRHSVDLSVPLLVLGLLQSFLDRTLTMP